MMKKLCQKNHRQRKENGGSFGKKDRERYLIFFMEQRLTCANHSDEVVLEQIGWNNFDCPKCGSDYSIGRKVVSLDPQSSKDW